MFIKFPLSKSNWGAVNLAAQRQLSENCAMRERKRQRVERETKRVRHKGSLGSLC